MVMSRSDTMNPMVKTQTKFHRSITVVDFPCVEKMLFRKQFYKNL